MTLEDEYTDTVDRIRIFHEGDGWAVDGFNTETNKHTQEVWKYSTRVEARDVVPAFVEELRAQGITVNELYSLDLGHPDPAEVVEPAE
jgi:hypothetical protein